MLELNKRKTELNRSIIFIGVIVELIAVYFEYYIQYYHEEKQLKKLPLLINATLRVSIDSYMYYLLINSTLFFIQQKSDILKASDSKFSKFNFFIISWSIFIMILNCLQTVFACTFNGFSGFTSRYDFIKSYYQIYLVLIQFLTAMTLLYLFYF